MKKYETPYSMSIELQLEGAVMASSDSDYDERNCTEKYTTWEYLEL
jgi:hypothetical protein